NLKIMASSAAVGFKLNVLNPGGRDRDQYFDGEIKPESAGHSPINFHAYAACTRGAFLRDVKSAVAEKQPVLLLLRGNFKASRRALSDLQKEGLTVVVSLKETGLHQIARQLADPGRMARFFEIVAAADGCIATTPETVAIYRRARPEADPATV